MVHRHHRLIAWRRAHAVAIGAHRYCAARWTPPSAAVMDQLRRAALSVPLNIAEGVASGPGNRCRYHLRIAYASAIETTEILNFMMDVAGQEEPQLIELRDTSREAEALLFRLWERSRKK